LGGKEGKKTLLVRPKPSTERVPVQTFNRRKGGGKEKKHPSALNERRIKRRYFFPQKGMKDNPSEGGRDKGVPSSEGREERTSMGIARKGEGFSARGKKLIHASNRGEVRIGKENIEKEKKSARCCHKWGLQKGGTVLIC